MNKRQRRVVILLSVLAVVFLLSGCTSRNVVNVGWTSVTATEDAVYSAMADGTMAAIDPESGQSIWYYPVEVASSSGFSLFGGNDDETGDSALQAVYGSPTVTDMGILVGAFDGQVYLFDAVTGDYSVIYTAEAAVVGGIAYQDGVAYFGSSDNKVYAVDVATSDLVWGAPFESADIIWSRPVVDDTHVYVAAMDHNVYALDLATGAEDWRYEAESAFQATPVLYNGVVYAGCLDKYVYALDAITGELLWEQPVDGWVLGAMVVYDDYVYVATLDGMVHSLSVTDGSARWEPTALGADTQSGVVRNEGHLVVATSSGEVWSIDPETGAKVRLYPDVGEIGETAATGSVLSTPAVVGDKAYVGTTTGYLFALDLSEPGSTELWLYSAAN